VRVKIVINHPAHESTWRVETILTRLAYFGTRAWDTLAQGMAVASRHVRQACCGLTGHEDVLRLQRQRLSLSCSRCGRVTRGWDLTDPTPPPTARTERPRYLELARPRSS
jgi:hypothetical protein